MNFNKALSVAAAAAMAVSMVAVSASATKYEKVEAVKIDSAGDNVAQWPIATFTDYTKIGKVTVKGVAPKDAADTGANGGLGLDTTDGWKQVDFNFSSDKVTFDKSTGEFTVECDFGGVTPDLAKSDGIMQLGMWWGGAFEITDILIDGTSILGLEAAAPAEEASAEETTAEVPAETTEETEAETTVEEEVEAEVEEEIEEEVEEDIEEDDAATEPISFEEDGVSLIQVGGEGTSNNWGQAVVMYTYNNIAEDEEPGENPFDVSLLNENSCIVVYYESDVAPELILQSWSGGNGWAKVPQNEEESAPGMAVFTYDYMTAMYESDDFSTVDAVNIGDQGADLTVNGVYVLSVTDEAAAEIEAAIEEAEEDTAEETADTSVAAPAADTTDSTAPKTGNAGLAAIAGVIAVAGAAAVAFKKRK